MGKLREGLSLGVLEVKVCVRVLEAKGGKKEAELEKGQGTDLYFTSGNGG